MDPINSVQFSTHTGYPGWRGEVLQGQQLSDLVEGLKASGLLKGYTHMLTGYIGSASFLRAVLDTANIHGMNQNCSDLMLSLSKQTASRTFCQVRTSTCRSSPRASATWPRPRSRGRVSLLELSLGAASREARAAEEMEGGPPDGAPRREIARP